MRLNLAQNPLPAAAVPVSPHDPAAFDECVMATYGRIPLTLERGS